MAVELATGYVSLAISTKGMGRDIAKQFAGVDKTALAAGTAAGKSFAKGTFTNVDKTALTAGGKAGKSFAKGFNSVPAKAFGRVGSKIGAGLKGGAIAAGVAIAGVLTAALAKGFGRLEAIDTATTKLQGLGHSAKEVAGIMNDALASVKGTAFGLDEAATVAATSIAAGIKPGKELRNTLKLVADAATIGGTSLGDMGGIFNGVAASNKVYNDTLNQLGDRGIPIVQFLADTMHKSAGEVTELASKGKIDFKTFQKAMKEGLGGAALTAGGTFQGALKNAGAALGRFGENLLKGAFPQLKTVLGGLTSRLDELAPSAKKIGAVVGGVFAKIIGWVKTNQVSIKGLMSVIGSTLSTFAHLVGAALTPFFKSMTKGKSGFKAFVDFVTEHQADIVGGFVKAGIAALEFGGGIVTAASIGLRALAGMIEIAGTVRGVFLDMLGGILHAASLAFGWIPGIGPKIKAASAGFDVFAAASKKGTDKAAAGARAVADALDKKVSPALKAARVGLAKVGSAEIGNAKQRDSAAHVANLIADIGTKADGSQIKLKTFAGRTKLSADAQAGLNKRLKDSATGLRDQLTGMKKAHVGQKQLTAAWKTGRDRLYDEFIQMGLSKKEAKKLAKDYADVQPLVKTKFTQPGMKDAYTNAKNLKNKYGELNRMKVSTRIDWDTAVDGINTKIRKSGGHVLISYSDGGYTGKYPVNKIVGGVHGDEHVIKSRSRRKFEAAHPGWLDYLNKHGKLPGYREGGRVFDVVSKDVTRAVLKMGDQGVTALLKKSHLAEGGGVTGSGAIVGSPSHLIREHNGFWSALFAANIRKAERAAGRKFIVYQAGFNHGRVKASGTTHDGDAIDARQDMGLRNAFRRFVGAMWFRNWPGNYHMHGVPAPGRGYGSPSARRQYQDYLRGGDGLGGYARGTLNATPGWHTVGERGPEMVKFKGGETVLPTHRSPSGGGLTINGGVHGLNAQAVAVEIDKIQRRRLALQPAFAA